MRRIRSSIGCGMCSGGGKRNERSISARRSSFSIGSASLQLLLAIVLADLGITLVHYASHR